MDNIADILQKAQMTKRVKPPAYQWQELALRLISELSIPDFKRSAVFKVCRDLPAVVVERSMNETKELCKTGAKWKYFFKVIDSLPK